MTRSEADLHQAATCVQGEWLLLAQSAALLPSAGVRDDSENAAMESMLVHARCLINFTCGNYRGNQQPTDIQPKDFLGVDWWPRDEPFERKLRGRLAFINQELQHLSWRRVDDKEPLIVHLPLLAHEVHWAMHLFVEELDARRLPVWQSRFASQEKLVEPMLPGYRNAGETVPHLAPARVNPSPP